MREVLSGRGLVEKPTRVPMRVGFGICKDCGDAEIWGPEVKGDAVRLKYGARRSR